MALSDDIWLSIDHNDAEALDRGYQFKKSYNEKLSAFDTLASDVPRPSNNSRSPAGVTRRNRYRG